jgi:hypothetical protein
MRLNEDGTTDSSFGINGIASLNDQNFANLSEPMVFLIQDNNEILIAGGSFSGEMQVAKVQENGKIDSTFATNGVSVLPNIFVAGINAIHLDMNGKILVGGANDYDFFMARLLNDVTTGSQENSTASVLHVFPNPVADQLILQTSFSPNNIVEINITNGLGQIIRQQAAKFINNKINVRVNDLSKGIYLVTLISPEGTSSTKFVKE